MAEKMKGEGKKELVLTRTVLWYLVFTGFAVNYMIRINLNIAIVSMVKPKNVSKESIARSSECLREAALQSLNDRNKLLEMDNITSENNTSMFSSLGTLNNTENTPLLTKMDNDDKFEGFAWNEYHQGLILAAFFWLHWLTQVPGGILAQKYGAKLVYGMSNFSGVLCCFLIPVASYAGWKTLLVVRCFQGLVAGFAWPAMHSMTAKWVPPNERSKFVTAYLGSSVGAALTYPMCGFIIDWWGWEYAFYVNGILGTVWFIGWWMLVFDSPAQHPRISEQERDYIHDCLGHSVAKQKAPVPWRSILTSLPVWMNILAQWGGIWGLFTLMTHAPTYFKQIHGMDIKTTGLLSGMPHMMRMLVAYVFSLIGDYLLRSNKMSRSNVRKLATALCTIGQGFCLLALAYSGCNYHSAIVFLTLATAIHGTVSSGPLASLVDISPNYASITLGLVNTIVACVGFLTPYITGYLTLNNQTVGQWQIVFLIAVAMLMISGIAYVLFSRSELEPWNSPDTMKNNLGSELKALRPERDEKPIIITEKEKN